ncbi:hypothetical protein ACTAE5_14855, partial [Streptomyces antibioticus]
MENEAGTAPDVAPRQPSWYRRPRFVGPLAGCVVLGGVLLLWPFGGSGGGGAPAPAPGARAPACRL